MTKHPAGTSAISTPPKASMYGVQSPLYVTGSNPEEGGVPASPGPGVAADEAAGVMGVSVELAEAVGEAGTGVAVSVGGAMVAVGAGVAAAVVVAEAVAVAEGEIGTVSSADGAPAAVGAGASVGCRVAPGVCVAPATRGGPGVGVARSPPPQSMASDTMMSRADRRFFTLFSSPS
jgi:hypothetical protein